MWVLWFPFFGIGFWLTVAFFLLITCIMVESEKEVLSFVSLLLFIGVMFLFSDVTAQEFWNKIEWWHWFAGIGAYIVLGFLWARIKFHFEVHRIKNKILEVRKLFEEENKKRDSQKLELRSWDSFKKDFRQDCVGYSTEFNKSHTRKILNWAVYWPWSFIGTILNDPVRKFFRYIYDNYLVGAFQNSFRRNVTALWESSDSK